jgi:hypothetical protein
MKKKLKPSRPLRVNETARTKLVPLKVNAEEFARLQTLANRYTDGNVSEWMRYSGLNFKPGAKDFE